MKQGRSLQDVLTELRRQDNAKKDYIAPAEGMLLRNDGRTFEINHRNGAQEVFGTTGLFHRQMAGTLGIPAKYYDQMANQKPELLAENVNAWLRERQNNYMVRTMDYENGRRVARALLSDRYRRIDNMQIAAAVLPLFAGTDMYEVMSCEVTENRLYLKIVNHRLQTEVTPGDLVQGGVMISNSEVGLGSVSVQPLLYRLVCTNGMVVNELGERRTHVGRQVKAVENGFNLYSDEALEAEDKAFLLKLRDVTMAAVSEATFGHIIDPLKEAALTGITGHVQDVVELTSREFDLSSDEQDSVLTYLIDGGKLSLYGLANAVTRASQDAESYDRATQLESIGWDIVSMPKEQWKAINS